MRPKKRERRRAKTTVREATSADLLKMLSQNGHVPAGFFDPKERDVVLFPGADDSVREHEMYHSEQSGLFGLRADRKNRRTARKISNMMDQQVYDDLDKDGFSPLMYMIDDPLEFEAIVRSAMNSPEAKDVDFDQSFDEISEDLNAIPREETNTNIRLLRTAMTEGSLNKRQKELFLKALRANLRP